MRWWLCLWWNWWNPVFYEQTIDANAYCNQLDKPNEKFLITHHQILRSVKKKIYYFRSYLQESFWIFWKYMWELLRQGKQRTTRKLSSNDWTFFFSRLFLWMENLRRKNVKTFNQGTLKALCKHMEMLAHQSRLG